MQFTDPTPKVTYDDVTTKLEPRDKAHLDFVNAVTEVFEGAQDLLVRKHQDYGPKNISEAPGGALNGLLVRMHDKLARLTNLTDGYRKASDPDLAPQYESLRDSFVDLANYALIGVLVIDGDWPEA